MLVGGAAGGVGVFAAQLASLAGARVIGTASRGTFEFLRALGIDPVAHGPGLADRLRELAPEGITAAADLHGTEAAYTALELGVEPQRISVVTVGADLPDRVHETGAGSAAPDAMPRLLDAMRTGGVKVPIAARFPIDQIRDAVALQAAGHVHGKIAIDL